jgi:hypothetical protein
VAAGCCGGSACIAWRSAIPGESRGSCASHMLWSSLPSTTNQPTGVAGLSVSSRTMVASQVVRVLEPGVSPGPCCAGACSGCAQCTHAFTVPASRALRRWALSPSACRVVSGGSRISARWSVRAASRVEGVVLVLCAIGCAPMPDRKAAAGPNEVRGAGSGVAGWGLCAPVGAAEEWFLHHTGSQWWESCTMVIERPSQAAGPARARRLLMLPRSSGLVHTVSRGAAWGRTQCATASHHKSCVVQLRAVA